MRLVGLTEMELWARAVSKGTSATRLVNAIEMMYLKAVFTLSSHCDVEHVSEFSNLETTCNSKRSSHFRSIPGRVAPMNGRGRPLPSERLPGLLLDSPAGKMEQYCNAADQQQHIVIRRRC